MIAGLAALLGAAAVAPGCDDITARSFGGNAAETGGVGVLPDGGLSRGHGGATVAISTPSTGAGGMAAAAGGASGAQAVEPASGGGTAPSAPVTTGTGGVAAVGTGGSIIAVPSGTGGSIVAVPSGSGGAVATGGVSGSGGAPAPVPTSTGGMPGTGGVAATGGMLAAGGASGKSGMGAASGGSGPPPPPAGGGGAGDKTPTDPDACTKLIATYDDAVAKGKSCDAGAKGPSCEKPVPAKLSGCGAACTTFVDDDSMAKMIQQQWSKAGCVPDACAVELCVNPTSASCTGSGNKGTCADSLLGI